METTLKPGNLLRSVQWHHPTPNIKILRASQHPNVKGLGDYPMRLVQGTDKLAQTLMDNNKEH